MLLLSSILLNVTFTTLDSKFEILLKKHCSEYIIQASNLSSITLSPTYPTIPNLKLVLYLNCFVNRISIEHSRGHVGAARESLGRLLKEFKEDKLISIESRNIRVTNIAGLLKVASSQ